MKNSANTDGVMASGEPVGPVAWEYRAWRDGQGGEPVGWGAWERVTPKGLQSMDDAVQEMIGYIRRGYRYELRSLYAVAHGVEGTLPPSGTAVGSCHRLIAHGVTQEWEWHGDGWGVPGNPHSVSPSRMSELGWRYVAAAAGVGGLDREPK